MLLRWFIRHPVGNVLSVLALLAGGAWVGLDSLHHVAAGPRRQALIALAITLALAFALMIGYVVRQWRCGRVDVDPDPASHERNARRGVRLGAPITIGLLILAAISGPIGGGVLAGLCGGVLGAAVLVRILQLLGIAPGPSRRGQTRGRRAYRRAPAGSRRRFE